MNPFASSVMVGFVVALGGPVVAQALPDAAMSCAGPKVQGGFLICSLPADASTYTLVSSTGMKVEISGEHPALIPFGRNADLQVSLTVEGQPDIPPTRFTLEAGAWAIERIDGLPPSKVTPRTPEQQQKVAADWTKKQTAWSHRAPASWFADGFVEPVVASRTSGVYGSQRILNGTPRNPHLGLDFAAPTGTKIIAPATAKVVLAEPDMYFEGGLLVLDHGAGVMSVMLHLSRIDVRVGEQVEQGQTIGAVGMTGRATGPHLHWGIKVRDTYINPRLVLDFSN
ncbi:MAG: M23 family metallopeptidase [Robiginitomaculum sp.]|nr:M23 family metallopeptidase [Robiginitomaculum sp.]